MMKKYTSILIFSCLSMFNCFGMHENTDELAFLWDMPADEFEQYRLKTLKEEFGSLYCATTKATLEEEEENVPEIIIPEVETPAELEGFKKESAITCTMQDSVSIFSSLAKKQSKRNDKAKKKKKKQQAKLAQALREQAAETKRQERLKQKRRQQSLRKITQQQKKEQEKQHKLASSKEAYEDSILNNAMEHAKTERELIKKRFMLNLISELIKLKKTQNPSDHMLTELVCRKAQSFHQEHQIKLTEEDLMRCLPSTVKEVKAVYYNGYPGYMVQMKKKQRNTCCNML